MIFRSFVLLVLMIVASQTDAQGVTKLDELYESKFNAQEPGCAVVAIKDGEIIFEKYIGIADIDTKKKIDAHTIFNTGSISKTFVAYGILILEEEGKLSIEDPILKYFTDFENPDVVQEVKIKHLLTHSSGLPDIRNVNANQRFFLTAKDDGNWEPIKKVSKLNFEPGERWEYSNPAFNGLALIIEQVSGMKWQKFIQEKIFKPAGMTESYITDGPHPSEGVAHAYTREGSHWQEADYGETPTFAASGNGGVWCSILDLVKYEKAIQEHRFLSEAGIKRSREILNFKNWKMQDASFKMGLSWFIQEKDGLGKKRVYHTGSQGGFRAFHIYIPDEEIVYLALFNRPSSAYNNLISKGLEMLIANP